MQRQISFEAIQIIKYVVNEKIYKHNTDKIFSFTNQTLQERFGPVPKIVLNVFFLTINSLCNVVEFSPNIIPYFIREWQ